MKRMIGLMLLWACPVFAAEVDLSRYYKIENIPMPPGLSAENGGVAFTPSGKLVTCWHHGEVYLHNPATGTWTLYAEGLQNPLGVLARSETEILVLQQSELTATRAIPTATASPITTARCTTVSA